MGKSHDLGPNSGLIISDLGLDGLIVETTAGYAAAQARHEVTLAWIDDQRDALAGGLLLLQLVSNEAILSVAGLKQATSPAASVYADDEEVYVEWTDSAGWRDRRILSNHTATTVAANGGLAVDQAGWKWAANVLRVLHPGRAPNEAWYGFISDAQAWWFQRMTGPLFAHAVRRRPFQTLPRAALARIATGRPAITGVVTEPTADLALIQATRTWSTRTATLKGLVTYVGQVARSKGPKHQGRLNILEYVALAMPVAAKEGRVQVTVLGAIRHALLAGGVRGSNWAPITLYEYLRQGLGTLVEKLLEVGTDELDGEQWRALYEQAMSDVRSSQRAKFAAFLEVFHRFLTIAGADPLPGSLSGVGAPLPPAASVISPLELQLAFQFIETNAPTPRIRLQAQLGIVLGNWIPLRTVELWCIRLGDVHESEPVHLSIFVRVRDGGGKSKSHRRQEDIEDPLLTRLLIDLKRLRCDVDFAGDEDVLLGEPGHPDVRHEELVTTELMNAALRWATGDGECSYYDLRHTVFSRRAEPILGGQTAGLDAARLLQVSAQGGHAGPSSSAAYIHWIERPLAELSQVARPTAWCARSGSFANGFQFPRISQGLVGERSELSAIASVAVRPAVAPVQLSVAGRADLAWLVAQNLSLDAVAGGCQVPLEVVHQSVSELVQAMVLARLVSPTAAGSLVKQCIAVSAWYLWARAARQSKWAPVAAALGEVVDGGRWTELRLIWQSWLQCLAGNDVELRHPQSAARLIQFLLNAKVASRSLAVVSAVGAPQLALEIQALRIPARHVAPRKGRPAHRLFMSEHGVVASEAGGATLSMVGLHWWILQVGALLVARGEV
ncbi:hypothetical protein ABT392_08240 [Paucibacter sp. JuS9]|uniref:hypothetical protein n=1 Tax=Paucibacter sp. JuS9 TaxID=3228748 RepID=UPI00375822CB